jgi:HK97 family phage major capsid protein
MMEYETKDGGFKSLGEFLVTTRKACDRVIVDSRLKTAGHLEEGEDSQGGFISVPEQFANEIMQVALEDAIVRPRAKVFNATSDSLKIRRFVETDRSSTFFGGITFKWLSEAAQKSYTGKPTKPALGQLELTPHKLVGSCFVSNELENDYGAFGDFMRISFGQAIRFIEDDYFIWGTGAGQPLGVANAAGNGSLIQVTRAANNAIDWTDFAHMAERLLPDSWNRAVWLINPDAIDELFEAVAPAANQATMLDLSNRRIFGIPFIPTEKCSALGTTGDVILADFGHYAIADRGMVVAGSRHVERSGIASTSVGFSTDESYWKVQLRVDGQPIMASDITPYRGANTLSAFVVLTTTS